MYRIFANQTDYWVTSHAARRMLQRGITDEMVIDVLENGEMTSQPHGTDLYGKEVYDELSEEWLFIEVVVDEMNHIIVTVIDNSDRL